MKNKRLIFTVTVLILIFISLTLAGCTGSKESDPYNNQNDSTPKNATGTVVVGDVTRKVYYTVDIEMYAPDMTVTADLIKTKTVEFGGYVQTSRESTGQYGGYYSFTVRIPTDKLNEFETAISAGGEVTDRYVTTTDITTQYVSAQARVEALEAERSALQTLLASATDVADIIAISDRISDINAELGALTRELNEYDSLIDYSTVNIRLFQEEKEETDDRTFGKKLADLFVKSFKSMGAVGKGIATVITAVFPYLFVLSGIGGIIFGIVILVRKKKGVPLFGRKKKPAPQPLPKANDDKITTSEEIKTEKPEDKQDA